MLLSSSSVALRARLSRHLLSSRLNLTRHNRGLHLRQATSQNSCRHISNDDSKRNAQKADITTTLRSAYVHPLSEIVLERLQSVAWIVAQDDTSLKLHEDGTFSLQFGNKNHHGRIFTTYDPEQRKHFLTVQRGDLVGRYVLQDNQKPAWHSEKTSVHTRVQDAVDQMIQKLKEDEQT